MPGMASLVSLVVVFPVKASEPLETTRLPKSVRVWELAMDATASTWKVMELVKPCITVMVE